MSLSDDEERILSEMEAQLYESDPRLVKDVSSTTVYTAAFRNVKWSIGIFVIGLLIMILTLRVHYLFSAAGFVVMLFALLFLERNAVKLGKAGMNQVMQGRNKGGAVGGYIDTARDKFRTRFKRGNFN